MSHPPLCLGCLRALKGKRASAGPGRSSSLHQRLLSPRAGEKHPEATARENDQVNSEKYDQMTKQEGVLKEKHSAEGSLGTEGVAGGVSWGAGPYPDAWPGSAALPDSGGHLELVSIMSGIM